MFEISVEDEFCAAHALVIGGVREPVHGHNWHLTVTVAGPTLDRDGLLLDFHALERLVREIVAPLRNANLDDSPLFQGINASAENIAKHIASELAAGLRTLTSPDSATDRPIRLVSVRVTEAPGCAVVYRP